MSVKQGLAESRDHSQDTMLLLVFLLTGLLGLVWLYRKRNLSVPQSSISAPYSSKILPSLSPSDPVLGNLPDIHKAGSFPSFLSSLHSEHGPIVGFWMGDTFTVSLGKAKYLRITERMFDRHPNLFLSIEPLISSKSIQFANGDRGKELYRELSRAFSQSSNSLVLAKVIEVTKQEVTDLSSPMDLHSQMMKLAIAVITRTHFGYYFESKDNLERLFTLYGKVFADFDDAILGTWTMGQGEERQELLEKNIKNFKDIVTELVNSHKDRKYSGEYDVAPFLDILVDLLDDEEDMVAQAVTFLVGGFHTTGMFLTFLFYYICIYPEVQEKMRKEIQTVLGKQGLVSIDQVEKLHYVKNVMEETLRVSRVGVFSERQVTEDIMVDGFRIKAGTQLLIPLSVILYDEENFPNPEMFDPERTNRKGSVFGPFGYGVRKCPGYRFSNLEVCVTAVVLLSKYRLEVDTTQDKVGVVFGFVAKPDRDIEVTVSGV